MTGRKRVVLTGSTILIAAHGVILYHFSSHLPISTAIVGGVIVLVIFQHLGLLGPVYAILRKARRRS